MVKTVRPVGRPSLEEVQRPEKKAARVQGNPTRQEMFERMVSNTCTFIMKKVVYTVTNRFHTSAVKDASLALYEQ